MTAALVDFAVPHTSDVRELVVTGPASPVVSTLDDLAGHEVFVRKSSAYYESLTEWNRRFAAENRPAIRIRDAPEELEDAVEREQKKFQSLEDLFRMRFVIDRFFDEEPMTSLDKALFAFASYNAGPGRIA